MDANKSTSRYELAAFSLLEIDLVKAFLSVVIFCVNFTIASPSFASAGDLDLSFGVDGIVTTDIGYDYNRGWFGLSELTDTHTYVQPDGKFIVFATRGFVRFNTDGTLDKTFGDNGFFVPDRPDRFKLETYGIRWGISQVIPLTNGKVLAAGFEEKTASEDNDTDLLIARYNLDGSLDTSFGNNGSKLLDLSDRFGGQTHDYIEYTFLNDDGTITGIGNSILNPQDPFDNRHYFLIKYTIEGEIDLSFGDKGISEIIIDGGFKILDVVQQTDGKFLLDVNVGVGYTNDYRLARINADGSLDTGFGLNGLIKPERYGTYTVQPDGKIIVAGSASDYPELNCGFGLYRYHADGSLDMEFGINGRVLTNFGCTSNSDIPSISSSAWTLQIKPDNKIVALGVLYTAYGQGNTNYDFALAQYHVDGTLDTSFGENGKVVTEFNSRKVFPYLLMNADNNKLLALGNLQTSEGPNPVVVRYLENGSIDTSYEDNGKFIAPVHWYSNDYGKDIISVQSDGKIIVGGHTSQRKSDDFLLVRYDSAGNIDTSFGSNGYVITDFTQVHPQIPDCNIGSTDYLTAIKQQKDGRIVAIGYSSFRTNTCNQDDSRSLSMARYHTDGTLDETFGHAGKVVIGPYNGQPTVYGAYYDLAIQDDGKIIVVGYNIGSYTAYAVMRFHPDGSLDSAFGVGGAAIFDVFPHTFVQNWEFLHSVALQPDGKIVVAGRFFTGFPPGYSHLDRWNIFRLNTDGTLDESFNSAGGGFINIFTGHEFGDMLLQPDGKILVVGRGIISEFNDDYTWDVTYFLGARFNIDGTPDTSFGTDGMLITEKYYGLFDDFGYEIFKPKSVLLQEDGRFVILGTGAKYYDDIEDNPEGRSTHNNDFVLLRFNENGSYDYSFGYTGITAFSFGSIWDEAEALSLQPDGKMLVVGTTDEVRNKFGTQVALARFEGVTTKIDELEGLITRIQELKVDEILNEGQARSLQAKIQAAIQQVDRENYATASKQLTAFINEVDALTLAGILSVDEGQFLHSEALRVIEFISL